MTEIRPAMTEIRPTMTEICPAMTETLEIRSTRLELRSTIPAAALGLLRAVVEIRPVDCNDYPIHLPRETGLVNLRSGISNRTRIPRPLISSPGASTSHAMPQLWDSLMTIMTTMTAMKHC